MGQVTRYRGTTDGHDVELEFDQKLQVLNRARLFVDGRELDRTKVFYGEKDLTATLDDGTSIAVRLHSGMMGELTRAQVRSTDGSWTDLAETA
jgi:hypothetical protein